MRLELLGGGGLRVPHLVYRLMTLREELDLEEILLYDVDRRRAETMAALCEELGRRQDTPVRLKVLDVPRPPDPVDFVLTAIRPGGDRGRARDEAVCREVGLLGQETTGAVGFLMALRTARPLVEGVLEALSPNPSAYVLNFTNPAGIMTDALCRAGVDKAVGLCDTPSHFLLELAEGLGLAEDDLQADYFGLNHMGFFTALTDKAGKDRLPDILGRLEELSQTVRPLGYFPPDVLRALGNLPTEYLHFYLDRRGSLSRQAATPISRGAQIETLNARFWERVHGSATPAADQVLDSYLEVMSTRSATYLRAETGSAYERQVDPKSYLDHPGYEAIAISAIQAVRGGPPARLMLDVAGGGESVGIQSPDVYETSVLVDQSGIHPKSVTAPSPVAQSLIASVKTYERLTLEAISHPGPDALLAALLAHPLVADGPLAMAFLDRAAAQGAEGVAGVWKPRG